MRVARGCQSDGKAQAGSVTRAAAPEEARVVAPCAARVSGKGACLCSIVFPRGGLLGAPAAHHAERCFVRKGSHGQVCWEILG